MASCLELIYRAERHAINHNGPAIWGGCVTRRKHRHDPGTLARKLSRCKEGMAWFLQIQVQVLSKPGVSRYKFSRSRYTVTVKNVF
jgi:hypothetical protein